MALTISHFKNYKTNNNQMNNSKQPVVSFGKTPATQIQLRTRDYVDKDKAISIFSSLESIYKGKYGRNQIAFLGFLKDVYGSIVKPAEHKLSATARENLASKKLLNSEGNLPATVQKLIYASCVVDKSGFRFVNPLKTQKP
jgi:hypothetical protein